MYASYLDLDLDLNNKECVGGGQKEQLEKWWKRGRKEKQINKRGKPKRKAKRNFFKKLNIH